MTDLADVVGGDVPDATRPAVVAVAADMVDVRDRILAGFESRRAVVEAHQELSLYSLGALPDDYYAELTRQMWPRGDGTERTILAYLLRDDARERDMDPAAARAYRREVVGDVWLPCLHRAIDRVRRDAGEYTNADDDSPAGADTDPEGQQHVAMRPAMTELGDWQSLALGRLLDGLADRDAIADWLVTVEVATRGAMDSFIVRGLYDDRTTRTVLTGGDDTHIPRLAVATTHLLPAMNRAARDLAARAGEQPEVALPTPDPKPS